MRTSQAEPGSRFTELSPGVFKAFCEDIANIFSVEITFRTKKLYARTVAGLEQCFGKPAAVICLRAEGLIKSTFLLVFGREALFTLGGIIAGLPEQVILRNRKQGSVKDGEHLSDTSAELGKVMLGAWNRVFRRRFGSSAHFTQTRAFVGNPWTNCEEKIWLTGSTEVVLASYEVTVVPLPSFTCCVAFPKWMFKAALSGRNAQQDSAAPEAIERPGAAKKVIAAGRARTEKVRSRVVKAEKITSDKTGSGCLKAQARSSTCGRVFPWQGGAGNRPDGGVVRGASAVEGKDFGAAFRQKVKAVCVHRKQQVSEPMLNIKQVSGEAGYKSAKQEGLANAEYPTPLCVKDIMRKDVLWACPENTVGQIFAKMDRCKVGHVVVGTNGTLDGIVSKSDIRAAMSPYLQSAFVRWRRPLDGATLHIKIKWVMSRPVYTVRPDEPLDGLIHDMCNLGVRFLPVVDEHGEVRGLITAFDVLRAFLGRNMDYVPALREACR